MSIPAIVKIAHALEISFYDILNDSGFYHILVISNFLNINLKYILKMKS